MSLSIHFKVKSCLMLYMCFIEYITVKSCLHWNLEGNVLFILVEPCYCVSGEGHVRDFIQLNMLF